MPIEQQSAVEQLEALRSGQISAVDLLEQTILHAERVSDAFNPFAIKLYERARQAARLADEQLANGTNGPLCGLPITIKDSQWLAGVSCANGSATQADFIPNETCAAVARLEQAGAVIFAKTTCPEFSLSGHTYSELYGPTLNPWDPNRTCGGSSGGAGAAVAAGAGAMSLGGDGGGSIRIPASFCGIVGFKPSFKAVPREPCFPSWSTLVSYGPMTRSVADARLMYSVLAENNEQFAYADNLAAHGCYPLSLEGQTIIVSEDMGFAPIDDDVRQTFRQVIKQLKQAGANIVYDDPDLPSSVIAWATVAHYDSWSFQQQKDDPHSGLERFTKEMMKFGASLKDEEFAAAEDYRHTIAEAYAAMFARHQSQIFITPSLGCEAFKQGFRHPKYIGSTRITYPWLDWASFMYNANLTGMPACALPMGLGNEGLPLSIQITGPLGTDATILDMAEHLETLIGWDNRPRNEHLMGNTVSDCA